MLSDELVPYYKSLNEGDPAFEIFFERSKLNPEKTLFKKQEDLNQVLHRRVVIDIEGTYLRTEK